MARRYRSAKDMRVAKEALAAKVSQTGSGETSEEPFLIEQRGCETSEEAYAWARMTARSAEADGATHVRITKHPDDEAFVLVEAWKTRPRSEGKPRWKEEAVDDAN